MNELTNSRFWNGRWRKNGDVQGRTFPRRQYAELLDRVLRTVSPSGRALKLGAAPGHMMKLFHDLRPDLTIDGIDISDVGTARANELCARHGMRGRVLLGDMFEAEAPRDYDVVYSHGLVEHFDDYAGAVAAHFRFSRPGGLVLVTVPDYRGRIVRGLLNRFSHETVRAHNFEAMRHEALAEGVLRGGGRVLESGRFGPPTWPSSAVNPGLGGRIYKRASQVWNLAAFLAHPVYRRAMPAASGNIYVLAEAGARPRRRTHAHGQAASC